MQYASFFSSDLGTNLYYASYIIWFLFGLAAWVFAGKIAAMFTPKNENKDIALAVGANDLVVIGSFLIGAYHLIASLPEAVTLTLAYNDASGTAYSSNLWQTVTSEWLKVILAILLALGSKTLARLVERLRAFQAHPIE